MKENHIAPDGQKNIEFEVSTLSSITINVWPSLPGAEVFYVILETCQRTRLLSQGGREKESVNEMNIVASRERETTKFEAT